MGAVKRVMGIDAVDIVIQVIVTGCLAALADAVARTESEGIIALIFAVSTVILGVRRQRALAQRSAYPETTGEVAALQVQDLEARVAELEHGQERMQELEERLDFAERMLAQRSEVRQLSTREES
jgi:hypothetical protein